LLVGQFSARAEVQHPVFVAPGFQFDQIDALCVMPLINAMNNRTLPRPDDLRIDLMAEVQKRGYRVLDPSCSQSTAGNAAQVTRPRWILTVKLDDIVVSNAAPKNLVMGSLLTASLFDIESAKEVWRDTAMPGFGDRFGAALVGGYDIFTAIDGSFGQVLAKFIKQKKTYPPSSVTTWPPMSLQASLNKAHSFTQCNGLLKFDAGTLSFEPSSNGKSDNKCESYRFSVQGAKFSWSGWLDIPRKGEYLVNPLFGDHYHLRLWDLALRSAL